MRLMPECYERELESVIGAVSAPEESIEAAVWARLDSLTKPPRSLGRLEELAAQVAVVQGTVRPNVESKALIVAAGDHGVVAEGVSPYPQDVTRQMVANIASGGAAINQVAASVGANVTVVDVGVQGDGIPAEGIESRVIAHGTNNMCDGPAMSREEAARACLVGIELAHSAIAGGVRLLGTGEMGIGNTTAASALTAAYTGSDPRSVVGPGTGLDEHGVAHKADVVSRALEVNHESLADPTGDPLGVLAAVGGLEIACLAGVVIGAASRRTCVVADGFISGSAVLAATRLCPGARPYVFASHRSAEPGHEIVLLALAAEPVLDLGMRLGEGTGAALAMGIIDAACAVLRNMATFEEAGVSEKGSESA
jgi:nicotinate-nucleotide--dimethylbenzimidazole phosphoribosyltransferase